ncbi:hypothetical protein [Moorena sp. SIO3B2]|uniref:hypothetical protein n=1 Tax=Moorena sp. SIO3B2 TaxID=2607827 RepID=UPI0013C98BCE|nr:hypothetical protein [Moorena sp. SIO3B2]NEP30450.1 hypothetical protein [Moorena sp. SIO3B2]NES87576.1 hypothetical protein [Moorena sp. SIO2B7]
MANRHARRVQPTLEEIPGQEKPSTLLPSKPTLQGRPRANNLQRTLHRIALGEQPWPIGTRVAFNLQNLSYTESPWANNFQPSTFNLGQ